MINLDRTTKAAEIIAHTAVVVGLVLAIIGYFSEKSARAERFTVEYASGYNSENMQAARTRIRSAVRSIENTLTGYRASNKAIATMLAQQVRNGSQAKLEADFLAIAEYFNGALSCVEAELCNQELFAKLHASEATSLSCLILPSLDEISLRGGQDELKKGLLHFGGGKGC